MSAIVPPRKLVVARSAIHGYGVFAAEDIRAGELLEECPLLLLEPGFGDIDTKLNWYVFAWPKTGEGRAVVFGLASVYNHGRPAHVDWQFDEDRQLALFFATRDAPAGTELLIDYSDEYWDEHPRYGGGSPLSRIRS